MPKKKVKNYNESVCIDCGGLIKHDAKGVVVEDHICNEEQQEEKPENKPCPRCDAISGIIENIKNEAHLKADHFTYDLMKTLQEEWDMECKESE